MPPRASAATGGAGTYGAATCGPATAAASLAAREKVLSDAAAAFDATPLVCGARAYPCGAGKGGGPAIDRKAGRSLKDDLVEPAAYPLAFALVSRSRVGKTITGHIVDPAVKTLGNTVIGYFNFKKDATTWVKANRKPKTVYVLCMQGLPERYAYRLEWSDHYVAKSLDAADNCYSTTTYTDAYGVRQRAARLHEEIRRIDAKHGWYIHHWL